MFQIFTKTKSVATVVKIMSFLCHLQTIELVGSLYELLEPDSLYWVEDGEGVGQVDAVDDQVQQARDPGAAQQEHQHAHTVIANDA